MGHAKVNCVARRVAATTPRSYLYHFARFDPCGGWSRRTDGVTHTAELPYVFGQCGCEGGRWPLGADTALSAAMMSAWSAFARGGNPGGGWRLSSSGAKLDKVFNASVSEKMETGWLGKQCALWDDVAAFEHGR